MEVTNQAVFAPRLLFHKRYHARQQLINENWCSIASEDIHFQGDFPGEAWPFIWKSGSRVWQIWFLLSIIVNGNQVAKEGRTYLMEHSAVCCPSWIWNLRRIFVRWECRVKYATSMTASQPWSLAGQRITRHIVADNICYPAMGKHDGSGTMGTSPGIQLDVHTAEEPNAKLFETEGIAYQSLYTHGPACRICREPMPFSIKILCTRRRTSC